MSARQMEWRTVAKFPKYEVSECGDLIRSATGTRLKGHLDSDGYPTYRLRNQYGDRVEIKAHRLVAEAFIGPSPSPTHQVAHWDGSRLHCHWKNLHWATSLENHDDRRVHGTGPIGEKNPRAKITEEDVRTIRQRYREQKIPGNRNLTRDLASEFELHPSTISGIIRGKTWSHVH